MKREPGITNVQLSPEVRWAAKEAAAKKRMSLRDFIERAVMRACKAKRSGKTVLPDYSLTRERGAK